MQNIEKLLNLSGIQIGAIEIADNEVVIKCSSVFSEAICPKCEKKCKRVPQYYVRSIRDLEIFGKKTILKLTVRQFKCQACHTYFNESFTFVNPKYLMTNRYREYIYNSCQGRDIKHVADKEGLSWDTVSRCYNSFIKKKRQN